MKRLSFITQFKIEYLLMFTGCRKGLGKGLECPICRIHDFRIRLILAYLRFIDIEQPQEKESS